MKSPYVHTALSFLCLYSIVEDGGIQLLKMYQARGELLLPFTGIPFLSQPRRKKLRD
jgi:hypothetical protein